MEIEIEREMERGERQSERERERELLATKTLACLPRLHLQGTGT